MIHLFENNSTGGNSKLKGKYFIIPYGVMKHLKSTLSSNKESSGKEYYEHLSNMISNGKIPYGDMKKIKSFFDNYQGDENSIEFILNGGNIMRNWVNMTLNSAVNNIKNIKYAEKEAGIENAFIKPHEKNRQTKNSTKVTYSEPNIDGNVTKNFANNKAYKYSENKIIIIKNSQLSILD